MKTLNITAAVLALAMGASFAAGAAEPAKSAPAKGAPAVASGPITKSDKLGKTAATAKVDKAAPAGKSPVETAPLAPAQPTTVDVKPVEPAAPKTE